MKEKAGVMKPHVLYTVTVLCGILLPLNTCSQCGKKVLVMKKIFVLFMPTTLWELININVLHYYELWAHERTSRTTTVKNWCSKNVICIEPCCFFYSRYIYMYSCSSPTCTKGHANRETTLCTPQQMACLPLLQR